MLCPQTTCLQTMGRTGLKVLGFYTISPPFVDRPDNITSYYPNHICLMFNFLNVIHPTIHLLLNQWLVGNIIYNTIFTEKGHPSCRSGIVIAAYGVITSRIRKYVKKAQQGYPPALAPQASEASVQTGRKYFDCCKCSNRSYSHTRLDVRWPV